MDTFVKRPNEDKKAFIEETASRLGVAPIVVEKDFWVCWTLKHLYAIDEIAPYLTFKGGTSLSKAYGLIERFSEDIDLTISKSVPDFAGFGYPCEDGITRNEQKRRFKSLEKKTPELVARIAALLEQALKQILGEGNHWKIECDVSDLQTLLFYYPKLFSYGRGYGVGRYGVGLYGEGEQGYILPRVKLEFGAKGGTDPSDNKVITPYVANAFPDSFEIQSCTVPTLAAERSFWEKVTILHALYNNEKLRDRMSRHYYDVYMMATKPLAERAIQDVDLLEKVVTNKSTYFGDKNASYGTAKIGSLKLVPEGELRQNLEADYKKMDEMFIGVAPGFEEMMAGIARLEERINGKFG